MSIAEKLYFFEQLSDASKQNAIKNRRKVLLERLDENRKYIKDYDEAVNKINDEFVLNDINKRATIYYENGEIYIY